MKVQGRGIGPMRSLGGLVEIAAALRYGQNEAGSYMASDGLDLAGTSKGQGVLHTPPAPIQRSQPPRLVPSLGQDFRNILHPLRPSVKISSSASVWKLVRSFIGRITSMTGLKWSNLSTPMLVDP